MKKFFISTLVLFIVIFGFSISAHAAATAADLGSGSTSSATTTTTQPYNCSSVVTATDYSNCCTETGDGTSAQCDQYENAAVVPGQIGSGTTTTPISTAAINSGSSAAAAGTPSSVTISGVSSCSSNPFNNLLSIAVWVECIIGAIVIPGIFTLAFVVFLWGVFKFIRASDQANKDDGKQFIYMGLIGLFVMVSVWGIIRIFTTTFGFGSTVPTLQTTPSASSASSSYILTGSSQ